MPESLRRNIVLTNQIAFVLFVQALLIGGVILSTLQFNYFVLFWIVCFVALVFGVLLANYLEHIYLSRLLLSIGLPSIILVSTIHSRIMFPEQVHEASYFIPRYFLIGVSIVPLLIFSFAELSYLSVSLAFHIGLIVSYNSLHYLFKADPESIKGTPLIQDSFISVTTAFAAIIIVSGCMFLIKQNHLYENRISALLDETREKNQKIEDSIRYALRLQSAIFPPSSVLLNYANSFFLYYKPKDIVSGDFYLFVEKPGHLIIGVVDCTGHGVPGAFMSIIANNAIKRAIHEYGLLSPREIIIKSAEFVKHEFGSGDEVNIYDGMDMSLVSIDLINRKLFFSGANQTLYYQANGRDMKQIKGSKNAPGFDFNLEKGLDEVEISYEKDDTFYMTSDGIQDQFGGHSDKKFGRKRLEKMLNSLQGLDMRTQCLAIEQEINNWKNTGEQTDDMCLVGYKLT